MTNLGRFYYRKIQLYVALLIMGGMFVMPQTVQAVSFDRAGSSITVDKVLNFAAGLVGKYAGLNSQSEVTNFNSKSKKLRVINFGFNSLENLNAVTSSEALYDVDEFADVKPEVHGKALVYPNPFRQNSDNGAVLGYRLSKPMDVEIHMYDMLAHLVVKKTFYEGGTGGSVGYNRLKINNELLEGHPLSAGVYFFLIIHDGKVLSKGKMAVKP